VPIDNTFSRDLDFKQLIDERTRHFTGRRWVLDRIDAWLKDPDGRQLFVLTGMPGTGKTSIAARLIQLGAELPANGTYPGLEGVRPLFAHFCRWQDDRTISPLRFIESLSRQLAQPKGHQPYALALTSLGDQHITIHATQAVQSAASWATVQNVVIESLSIGNLSAQLAFDRVVRGPLESLYASGFERSILIVVDALNEALTFHGDENVASLLGRVADHPGELPQKVRLLLTTVPDRRVLGPLEEQALIVDLIRDAPSEVRDVEDYAVHRLSVVNNQSARRALAVRIAHEAAGNFLYAYHVLESLTKEDSCPHLQPEQISEVSLPEGGLPGVYRQFLRRELARVGAPWGESYAPVLGPLVVGQAQGLTTEQVARAAAQLAGRPFNRSKVREITKMAGQFLNGDRPDGPFLLYHRSFAEFLLNSRENSDFLIDEAEAHQAIVHAYGRLKRDRWDSYAWRFLFTHAFRAGRSSRDFTTLFELADARPAPARARSARVKPRRWSGYLEDKLSYFASPDPVGTDYELLFDACELLMDPGRLAVYAAARLSLDRSRALFQTAGAPALLLRAAPERAEETLATCLGAAMLIRNEISRANALISFFADCPGAYLDHLRVSHVPDEAWKLLQRTPYSHASDFQSFRLIQTVARRRPSRLQWAEQIVQTALTSNYAWEGWVELGKGYLREQREPEAMRCLKVSVSKLLESSLGDVRKMFEACERIDTPEALRELALVASAGGSVWVNHAALNTRSVVLGAGLLALAGDHEEATRRLESLLGASHEGKDDEWQRALFLCDAAAALAQFGSITAIQHLYEKFERALATLTGGSRARLGGQLVKVQAAYVERGLTSPAAALQRAAALGPVELGAYGCLRELDSLIRQCAEARTLEPWFQLEANLAGFDPAGDRAYLAARLVSAWGGVGDRENADRLFEIELTALRSAPRKARPGGFIALAGAASGLGNAGLADELIRYALDDLDSIMDGFDRYLATEAIVAALDHLVGTSLALPLVLHLMELGRGEFRERVLSCVAAKALEVLPTDTLPQAADALKGALAAPPLTISSLLATISAAEALHRSQRPDDARHAVTAALRQLRESPDERAKWVAGAPLAEACLTLKDAESVRALIEVAIGFQEGWFASLMFRQIAEKLKLTTLAAVLEEKAEVFLRKIEGEMTWLGQVSCLGQFVAALGAMNRSSRCWDLFQVAARKLDEFALNFTSGEYGQEEELILETQACLSWTLMIWGRDEGRIRLEAVLSDGWLQGVVKKRQDSWSLRLHELARAIIRYETPTREQLSGLVFRAFRLMPGLAACWAGSIGKAILEIPNPASRSSPRRLLEQAYEELQQFNFDEGVPPDYQVDEVTYSGARALAEIGAALDGFTKSDRGTDVFEKSFFLASRITGEQMRIWALTHLVERCPGASPARPKIVKKALDLLPTVGEQLNRSRLAAAVLKTTPIVDLPHVREVFRYVESEILDVVRAVVQNVATLDPAACLVLRASALHPPDVQLYAVAEIAKEQARRERTVDATLVDLLVEKLRMYLDREGV
jgi:hypothetical protein